MHIVTLMIEIASLCSGFVYSMSKYDKEYKVKLIFIFYNIYIIKKKIDY